jgi:hypothetical protein
MQKNPSQGSTRLKKEVDRFRIAECSFWGLTVRSRMVASLVDFLRKELVFLNQNTSDFHPSQNRLVYSNLTSKMAGTFLILESHHNIT